MMTAEEHAALMAEVLANSRKLQARSALPDMPVLIAIPVTTAGEAWRELIDRLNAVDPEGGWGRLTINGVEMIATKGTFPGPAEY